MNQDLTQMLAERVAAAQGAGRPQRIQGGGTKAWLGRTVEGETLEVAGHRGILSYEPTELVITARAGTPLAEIKVALAERGQWLAFEPPHFDVRPNPDGRPGADATLGGIIACGLSGPARPYAGAARDFVLGVRIINGRGEVLRFGGEVMKNVAGYDLSRLMVGAQGTLGVLLEVSLKVLPRPATDLTLALELTAGEAIDRFNRWAGQPLPLSAACHDGERAYVRLAGSEAAVQAARARLGGEAVGAGADFWRGVRELSHAFFRNPAPLWRLSLPPTAPHDPSLGPHFIDWGGALRWVQSEHPLWPVAQAAGGHATCYGRRPAGQPGLQVSGQAGDPPGGQVFQPLPPALLALHQRLKAALDPRGILNPGRLYRDL
ncbi:MAG: glycolate oxidase subunit GlcE [Chromatiaceae bacterium]|nr:glycolate oxidase subunit GlcE [Chromatiaceae bacterium]